MKRLIFLLSAILMMSSCIMGRASGSEASDDSALITKDYDLKGFDAIDVSGAFKVEVSQGAYSVDLEIPEDLEEYLVVKVSDHKLIIGYRNIPRRFRLGDLQSTARISLPQIRDIDCSGATRLVAKNLESKDLDIDCSGASAIELSGNFGELSMDCSGASKADLTGSADIFEVECAGASNVDAANFLARIVDIEVSGASKMKVNATERIEGECSGASKILYKSTPETTVRINTSGASKVSEM